MRIVHVAPNAPYNDGWGYQENLLPKFQAKLGNEVILIVSNYTHENGEIRETECTEFISKDGFMVVRRKSKPAFPICFKSTLTTISVYELLIEFKPDLIFFHGMVSPTIFQVTKYKRRNNPEVIIVQDNHLDYNIGFNPDNSFKERVICWIYRSIYMKNKKYISKVYGVTPWRREYAQKVFGVESKKADVLIMGADDEKLDFQRRDNIRREIREKHKIAEQDFFLVSGGKLDTRKRIVELIKAVRNLNTVKLLVFGSVENDIKEEFYSLIDAVENVEYIGWIPADSVYSYFFACDLAVFPGQHSVLWEQACASKTPCLFSSWKGMEHVNNGGNSRFIEECTIDSIHNSIKGLIFTDEYWEMHSVAVSNKTDVYLYSGIAKKSVEMLENV